MTVRKGQKPPNYGGHYPAEPITAREVSALLARCSLRAPTGVRNRAMLTVMFYSGLRVSEVLALKPSDVDQAKHSVRVLHGKGERMSVRSLHPSADDALARWLDVRKARKIRSPYLFCTLDGQAVSDRYVRDALKRMARRAGLERRVNPHAFRHGYAVMMMNAGTPMAAISKLLGHSSITVTARYLDHLTNDQAVTLAAGLELPEVG